MATLVRQDPTEGYNFHDFPIRFSISNRKHQIEILKEDIKLVVMGKPGCEKREDSILTNTSRLFWTITSQLQGTTKKKVISTKTPQMRKPFDCDLAGRHEACSCGQI